MGSAEELDCSSRRLAQRFLRTAVVVDDKAYMEFDSDNVPETVVAPDRRNRNVSQEDQDLTTQRSDQSLDARSITNSFSTLGVICGVVGPAYSEMDTMRQADIVVLDWRLKDDDSEYALVLLYNLLTEEKDYRNSLRLVAIYTGENQLEDISSKIVGMLNSAELSPNEDESSTTISYRHGRVVVYAKSSVNLAEPIKYRSVAEEDLPNLLIEDFAEMTEGLLPSIALTSLTAVREGEHKVLDRFRADLDPAFLAHRVCISDPEDTERQIVHQVAEELRGLMDNAVAAESPAGADAVESWIRRKGENVLNFQFNGSERNLDETVKLAKKGLEKAGVLQKNAFEGLSAGFAGQSGDDLDKELAWIMSFRTVYSAPPPTLWLGSIVTKMIGEDERHLICMRPRCDCVRLDEATSFFFLPLVKPIGGEPQLVVRFENDFKRLGIGLDPIGWLVPQFEPSESKRAVIATTREPNDDFEFTDTCGKQYVWRGELKAEYAQRIAQTFASTLNRPAVDESEWLRRKAKKR